jgi:hypothetical protein
MTPKEKAKDLFTTFRYALSHKDAPLGMHKDNIAIQCALIAVDEILNAIGEIFETYEERKYWQEVKQEIEKL